MIVSRVRWNSKQSACKTASHSEVLAIRLSGTESTVAVVKERKAVTIENSEKVRSTYKITSLNCAVCYLGEYFFS